MHLTRFGKTNSLPRQPFNPRSEPQVLALNLLSVALARLVFFWIKMTLFVLVIALEIYPLLTFIRWRQLRGRGQVPDTSGARGLYIVNHVEMAVVVIIVFVAAFMARGFGAS